MSMFITILKFSYTYLDIVFHNLMKKISLL